MDLVDVIHQHLPEVQKPDLTDIDVDSEHGRQKVMKKKKQVYVYNDRNKHDKMLLTFVLYL